MNIEGILFYFFATILVFSAGSVVFVRNSVRAALFLILCFFTSSVLWMLIDAEFLAIALILVYVGAVMVLFLFVIMMLDMNLEKTKEGFGRHLPIGLLVAGVMLFELVLIVGAGRFSVDNVESPDRAIQGASNTKEIARVLYTDYVYAFEIAAVILLVGIVAAISLTLRTRSDKKKIDPGLQSAVNKKDRIRVVDLKQQSGE